MSTIHLGKRKIADIEKRAAAARLTMGEVCDRAKVAHSTWSRAKSRGTITVTTLRDIEAALPAAAA